MTLKRKIDQHDSSDGDDYEHDRPKKKIRLETEIVNKQNETSISLDAYKTQRVLDDMHDDIYRLSRQRKKDKKRLTKLFADANSQGEDMQATDITTNKDTKTGFDFVGFFTRTLGTFLLPVLLFTIDQVTQAATKHKSSSIRTTSSSVLPSNSNSSPPDIGLYK